MPVPDNYKVEPNKPKKYTPIPEDKYQVMIYDVEAITEKDFKGENDVDKLNFTFVVLDDKKFDEEGEDGETIVNASTRGRKLWRKVPKSFSPGGRYRASLFFELMCAIERKMLTKDDLVAVDPNSLIGQQLCVFVRVNDSYNNIESFIKAQKDMDGLPTIYDKDESELEKAADKAFPVKEKTTVSKTAQPKEELF